MAKLVELPRKVGYEQAWDDAYEKLAYETWKNSARYPEELAPEWEPEWFWQRVYPLIYQLRLKVWFSKPVQAMWHGYRLHETDRVRIKESPYYTTKEVPARIPMWLQKKLQWLAKNSARCWVIGHLLEAMAIGDQWGWDCPHCGFRQSEDLFFNPWYRFTHGGSRFTGEYTQHWFEGFFDCPRCLKRWDYEDSD